MCCPACHYDAATTDSPSPSVECYPPSIPSFLQTLFDKRPGILDRLCQPWFCIEPHCHKHGTAMPEDLVDIRSRCFSDGAFGSLVRVQIHVVSPTNLMLHGAPSRRI